MVSDGEFTYYLANIGEKGVSILKIDTPKCPKTFEIDTPHAKLTHLFPD